MSRVSRERSVQDVPSPHITANRDGFDAVTAFATRTGWLHPVMAGYATYGVVGFAALLLAGWWLARRATNAPASTAPSSSAPSPVPSASSAAGRPARKIATALWAPVGMLIALRLNQIVVASVHELRPYIVLPAAEVLVARRADYAFPSDHAVMAGAVAAGVWLASRPLGYLAAAAELLMASARVYVGAHWPGDVLVGLVFGAAVTILGYLLWRTPLTSAVFRLARSRLRPLLTAHATALENLEAEPDRTEGAQLVADSSGDGSDLPWVPRRTNRGQCRVRHRALRRQRWYLRFGRYVFLTEDRLNKAEGFFTRHGGKLVTIARFVEGLRQANGIVAGLAGMPWRSWCSTRSARRSGSGPGARSGTSPATRQPSRRSSTPRSDATSSTCSSRSPSSRSPSNAPTATPRRPSPTCSRRLPRTRTAPWSRAADPAWDGPDRSPASARGERLIARPAHDGFGRGSRQSGASGLSATALDQRSASPSRSRLSTSAATWE